MSTTFLHKTKRGALWLRRCVLLTFLIVHALTISAADYITDRNGIVWSCNSKTMVATIKDLQYMTVSKTDTIVIPYALVDSTDNNKTYYVKSVDLNNDYDGKYLYNYSKYVRVSEGVPKVVGCDGFLYVYIPSTVTSLDELKTYVQENQANKITVAKNNACHVEISADNQTYTQDGPFIYNKAMTKIMFVLHKDKYGNVVTEYEIPSGVISGGLNEDGRHYSLSKLTFAKPTTFTGVIGFCDQGYNNLHVTTLEVPKSLTTFVKNWGDVVNVTFEDDAVICGKVCKDNVIYDVNGADTTQIYKMWSQNRKVFHLPNGIEKLADGVLRGTIDTLYAGTGLKSFGTQSNATIKYYKVPAANPYLKTDEFGNIYTAAMDTIVWFNKTIKYQKYELPASIKVIMADAFKGSTIDDVVFGANVRRLTASAFQNVKTTGNKLKYIDIANIDTVEAYAMSGTRLKIRDEAWLQLRWLGNQCFSGTDYSANVVDLSNVTYFETEFGVTWGKGGQFAGAKIDSLILPDHMTVMPNQFLHNANVKKQINLKNITTLDWMAMGTNGDQGNTITNATVDLKNVTKMAGFSMRRNNMVTLYVRKNITSAGGENGSLAKCYKLEHLYFDDGVTQIPSFYGATALQEVDLNNVEAIPSGGFQNCTSLSNVTMNSVTSLGSSAFKGCTKLTSIDLSHVTSIGSEAFSGSGLSSVELNGGVTELSAGAFMGAKNLKTVDLKNISVIGANAFKNSGLTEIDLSNVTEIGDNAFEGCENLKVVNLKNVTKIGKEAFKNAGLTAITLMQDTTVNVGTGVFFNNKSLTTLKIGSGMKVMSTDLAYGCDSLVTIELTEGVDSLSDNAWSGLKAKSIRNIFFPTTLKYIGDQNFNGFTNLENVWINSDADVANAVNAGVAGTQFHVTYSVREKTNVDSLRDLGYNNWHFFDKVQNRMLNPEDNKYYGTYFLDRSFAVPAGLTMYTINGADYSKYDDRDKTDIYALNLTRYNAGDSIPAGTAVIVTSDNTQELRFDIATGAHAKAEADEISESELTIADIKLEGFMHETMIQQQEGYRYYKLTIADDDPGDYSTLGFYGGAANCAAFKSAAQKAYLAVKYEAYLQQKKLAATGASGAKFMFNVDRAVDAADTNDVTEIQEYTYSSNNAVKGMYNLNGQKVENGYKGIVIVNGKKIIK